MFITASFLRWWPHNICKRNVRSMICDFFFGGYWNLRYKRTFDASIPQQCVSWFHQTTWNVTDKYHYYFHWFHDIVIGYYRYNMKQRKMDNFRHLWYMQNKISRTRCVLCVFRRNLEINQSMWTFPPSFFSSLHCAHALVGN